MTTRQEAIDAAKALVEYIDGDEKGNLCLLDDLYDFVEEEEEKASR